MCAVFLIPVRNGVYDGTMSAEKRKGRVLLVCFWSCAAAVLLVSARACKKTGGRDAPGPDEEQVEREKPGKCRSDHLKGTCTFLSMIEMPDDDSLKPAGTPLYRVSHGLKLDPPGFATLVDPLYL